MADCNELRSSSPPSFLTALPLELRSYIYSHLLVSPQPIKGPLARSYNSERYDIHTTILRTCKQINLEARQIFFGKNTFCISSVPPTAASLPSRTILPAADEAISEHEKDAETIAREGEPEITTEADHQTHDPPTGAFEPPLQISDLHFVRHLEIDLLYYPKYQTSQPQQQTPTGADRYITNLSHLLTLTKPSLTSLSMTFDARPHLSLPYPHSPSRQSLALSTAPVTPLDEDSLTPSLNLPVYLLGPSAADSSSRFKSSLSSLSIPDIALRFDFPEARFDFKKVRREVLGESCLVSIVGQVLMARSEIGIRGVLEEIGEDEEGGVREGGEGEGDV